MCEDKSIPIKPLGLAVRISWSHSIRYLEVMEKPVNKQIREKLMDLNGNFQPLKMGQSRF